MLLGRPQLVGMAALMMLALGSLPLGCGESKAPIPASIKASASSQGSGSPQLLSPKAQAPAEPPANSPLVAPEAHILVLYTIDIHGELLPCGCTTGPLGGFTHRGGLLEAIEEEGLPSLILDGGNLLLGERLIASEGDDREAEAELLFELARHHGIQAMAVGLSELALGSPEGLAKLRGEDNPLLLSANLRRGDEAAFPASTVFEVGEHRIGVIGVTERPVITTAAHGLEWEAPGPRVREVAEGLRGDVDLILVLSNLDALGNDALLKAAPNVDFILGGESDRLTSGQGSAGVVGSSPPYLLSLSGQGRFLGRLDLLMLPEAGGAPALAEDIPQALRSARIAREGLEGLKARILEEEGAENPGRLEREGAFLLRQIASANKTLFEPRSGHGFAYAPLPVLPSSRLDDVAAAMIAAHQGAEPVFDVKEAEAYRPGLGYGGNQSCRGCHPLQQAAWMGQAHAKAWKTLKALGKERDPECLSCHTTGFKVAGGFFDVDNPRAKEGVGCESCHGPLSDHPAKRRFLQLTNEGTCLGCHDAINSPNFAHREALPGVTCPSGVLREDVMIGELSTDEKDGPDPSKSP